MILSGEDIQKRLNKDIIIKPYHKKNVNPNSYNLYLYNELLLYKKKNLDMKEKHPTKKVIIPKEGLILYPNRLYLGRTVEYTETMNLVPMLEGRSSIGRLGMSIHVTAGFGDIGFKGYWTLEIHVIQPLRVYPNVSVCQIFYHTIQGYNKTIEYKGKYQNNKSIQESMLYKEFI